MPKQWEKKGGRHLVSQHHRPQFLYCFRCSGSMLGRTTVGSTVTLYTWTNPPVMLRWQGRRRSSRGGCTAWKQCLGPQGRCKVTGATWPGFRPTVVTTGAAAGIRMEYLSLCVTGRTWSSFGWIGPQLKPFLKITPEHEKGREKATNGKICEKCCSCLVSTAAPLQLLNQKVAVFSV